MSTKLLKKIKNIKKYQTIQKVSLKKKVQKNQQFSKKISIIIILKKIVNMFNKKNVQEKITQKYIKKFQKSKFSTTKKGT